MEERAEGGFRSVKRAREMEDDENRSIPPSYCSHVAWGYQAVNIKTNYRTGNFTDREDLSPSGAFSLAFSLSLSLSIPLSPSLRVSSALLWAIIDSEKDRKRTQKEGTVSIIDSTGRPGDRLAHFTHNIRNKY